MNTIIQLGILLLIPKTQYTKHSHIEIKERNRYDLQIDIHVRQSHFTNRSYQYNVGPCVRIRSRY